VNLHIPMPNATKWQDERTFFFRREFTLNLLPSQGFHSPVIGSRQTFNL
jgi:hypothetical protein